MEKRYYFFGQECPHCIRMHPIVEKMEKSTGVKLSRFEVWHHPENVKIMQKFEAKISEACGEGVGLATPAFFNEETGEALCGEQKFETLKEWAVKKTSNKACGPHTKLKTK